jgi:hypothetical protein
VRAGTGGQDSDDGRFVVSLAKASLRQAHSHIQFCSTYPGRSRTLNRFKRAAIDFPTVTFVYQFETKDQCLGNIMKGEGHSAGCC